MSERAERLDAALDGQWRTTRELAELAGVGAGVHMSSVHHTLTQAVKHGRAEKRTMTVGNGVRVVQWRRRAP